MDRTAIEATFEANEKLIRRRALKAGAKALTIGTESLAETIDAIGDAYGLTGAQRRQLEPAASIEAQEIVGKLKGFVGPAAIWAICAGDRESCRRPGLQANLPRPRAGSARAALPPAGSRRGWPCRTCGALGGAGRGGWGVGNGGWFWWRAHAYNRACRDLLLAEQGGVVVTG